VVLSLLLACVHTVHGVLVPEEERLWLYRSEGRPLAVVTGEASRELEYLGDCTVQLEGRQLGRRLTVQDWTVLAAGDGSAPFIGVLRWDGSRLLMDDRFSGATYVLEGHDDLRAFEGKPVMIIGYVTGPQVVQVMGWRLLADE